MQGGDGWVRWFSVFSVCLLEETARETFGHEQTLCHFLKKNCGQFPDRFHVHNRGIIYSKEHYLSNFGQSEKEVSLQLNKRGCTGESYVKIKMVYIGNSITSFMLVCYFYCSMRHYLTICVHLKSTFPNLISFLSYPACLFHFYHVSYLQFMCPLILSCKTTEFSF